MRNARPASTEESTWDELNKFIISLGLSFFPSDPATRHRAVLFGISRRLARLVFLPRPDRRQGCPVKIAEERAPLTFDPPRRSHTPEERAPPTFDPPVCSPPPLCQCQKSGYYNVPNRYRYRYRYLLTLTTMAATRNNQHDMQATTPSSTPTHCAETRTTPSTQTTTNAPNPSP